mmetsp:Transcript_34986/g.64792  ORF Transcript_34986/g.64792 Transcript_34986/m.64792 type:complete len:148 (-) Transcript_34986:253-696(-)
MSSTPELSRACTLERTPNTSSASGRCVSPSTRTWMICVRYVCMAPNTTQHNTTQRNTTQHSAAQHSTAQHNTLIHPSMPKNNPCRALLCMWGGGVRMFHAFVLCELVGIYLPKVFVRIVDVNTNPKMPKDLQDKVITALKGEGYLIS